MHRLLLGEPAAIVDHVNGDTTDNRRENLRLCSHTQNMQNRKVSRSNRSGFKGIYPDKGRWRAEIQANGIKHRLGSFETPEAAAAAYQVAAEKLHGAFARVA
jgi:hypothetical protein